MTTRTTSGVLAVLAGILVVPTAAQAVETPTTTTTTSATETAPPVTTEKSSTTTTTVPTITEPAPTVPPITTTTSPSTSTSEAPTTTTTTDTTATVPRGNRSNAPEGDDAEKAAADQDKQTRAEKRREARAAKKQAAADKKQAAKKDAKAKKDQKDKAKKDEAKPDDAATTTEEAAADGTTSSDDPAAMAQDPVNEFAPELLDTGLASQVPNFFINQFKIPPFLLPIYQAAGIQYGIRWEILAAINEIETDYGRNLSISTAGAQGWMQFMPATWASYGLDANGDGKADPYNPVDAIFSAARYLKAAGSDTDIRKAIFAYNHADWYVNSVLARARLISVLPTDLVGSLVGLTQGIFPVTGKASYIGADDGDGLEFGSSEKVRNAEITAKAGSDAVAVQDGTITAIGESVRLGKFVKLRDVYGNVYTYAHLDAVAETYAAAKDDAESDTEQTDATSGASADPAPKTAASAGKQQAPKSDAEKADAKKGDAKKAEPKVEAEPKRTATDRTPAPGGKERVYANPDYAAASSSPSAAPHGDLAATDPSTVASKPDPLLTPELLEDETTPSVEASTKGMVIRPLRKGSRVVSGTKLGTIATTEAYNEIRGRKRSGADASVDSSVGNEDTAADAVDESPDGGRMTFEIRPAGDDAPRIDPRPILEGWQLLQTSSVYAAHEDDGDAMFSRSSNATAGQVLLMTKAQLQRRVLADKNVTIYEVGRQQIAAGLIDRRVLATLAYLSASGHKLSVSSLSRPGAITSSGNVSDHSSGNAIDIASVDGEVISAATQGRGSITDTTIKRLLQLQGTVRPHQIISLMTPSDFGGASNILALPDHDDHIHVGFAADASDDPLLGRQLATALKPGEWDKLIDRLGKITNPKVSAKPSKYALKVKKAKKTAAERSNGD